MKNPLRLALLASIFIHAPLFAVGAYAHEDEDQGQSMAGHRAGKPFGHAADLAQATRTVTVTMNDNMRFSPATLEVKQGETLRLHVVNSGRIEHEFVLGDKAALESHAARMKEMPGMVHREPNTIRLAPGKEGDVAWTFSDAGDFVFACQIPGHWEAGMEGTVTVAGGGDDKR